jgi:biotin carboxyl carrier protein
MRFLRHSLSGLFLVSVTLALIVWAGALVVGAVQARLSEEPRVPPARERVFAVNVVTAEPDTIRPVLTAFGEIRSRRTLELRASAAGEIVEISEDFENGGQVEAGQALLRVDPVNAEAALARAEADLADAEAEVRDAERAVGIARDTRAASEDQAALRDRAFRRQLDLQERGVGTAATVEDAELAAASARQAVLSARSAEANAEARVDQAATALARAELARDEARRDLEDTVLRASFAGILSDVTAVEGGLVSANEQLGQLVDPSALEVAFRLSTAQYARLLDDTGRLREAPVTVTLDVQGIALTAEGRISRDSAAVGEGQVGRLVFARLDEARGLIPGDFVTVTTEEPALENVVRLPATALDAAGTVLVVNSEERLEVLQVTLERRQGDDVLVRAEALDGQAVVRERTPLLGAGIKVRPIRPAEPSAARADEPAAPAMVALEPERRARIRAYVEASERMPAEMKTRILSQLDQPEVPVQMVERIESRMGG